MCRVFCAWFALFIYLTLLIFSYHRQPIVYQVKLSKLNVGGVVDILHQVDELRPSLDQIIPKLKENGISGKVLRHCDLKELKNVSGGQCAHPFPD